MGKRRLIGWIILIVIIILLVVGAAGFYFYNYYVFKTIRICVGDGVEKMVPCNATQDCIDNISSGNFEDSLNDAPDFIKEKAVEILNEVIYCDGVCFVRNVRGIDVDTGEIHENVVCEELEEEFVIEIRGKEGLEIWKYLRDRE